MPVKPLPAEDLAHVLTHTRELWAEARGQSFFYHRRNRLFRDVAAGKLRLY